MSDNARDDQRFGDRVAQVLRTEEQFGDDFEESLVVAIRAERPIRSKLVRRGPVLSPAWWRTPRTLRVSPLAGLAYAASLAAVTAVAAVSAAPTPDTALPVTMVAQTRTDTVTLVRFVFVGRAQTVSLVGDFNRWGAEQTPLTPSGLDGMWTASVRVPQGRHEYAFIVDGKRWVPDPTAPTTSDEFDTRSSIVTVGS
ncbi:MAG: glycogen-binding domain-containing protein [Gemmatimonadota bacterium]